MRILICNDDGIGSPGLARLAAAVRTISDDVWVVAPDRKHTAAGPSLTMAEPITMQRTAERWYSCSGRPADCVITAVTWLLAGDERPDLVLGGINDGRNVAEDLAYSGTLGIAREASFWGIPAIGFSQVKLPEIRPGDDAWLGSLIARFWNKRAEWALEGHWLSINLPSALPAEIRQPRIGRDKIARRSEVIEQDGDRTVLIVPRGRDRTTTDGDENSVIDAGHITVNRINWFGETRLDATFLAELAPA